MVRESLLLVFGIFFAPHSSLRPVPSPVPQRLLRGPLRVGRGEPARVQARLLHASVLRRGGVGGGGEDGIASVSQPTLVSLGGTHTLGGDASGSLAMGRGSTFGLIQGFHITNMSLT